MEAIKKKKNVTRDWERGHDIHKEKMGKLGHFSKTKRIFGKMSRPETKGGKWREEKTGQQMILTENSRSNPKVTWMKENKNKTSLKKHRNQQEWTGEKQKRGNRFK